MVERIGKDIIVHGDVLPIADYYDGMEEHLDEAEQALRDALETEQSDEIVAPEVLNLARHSAYEEERWRRFGASAGRIAAKVGKPYEIALTKLSLQGIDISGGHPPEARR